MKAIVIDQYGGKEQLKEREMDKPKAEKGQVVVKLHATSINPIDWKLREGYLQEMVPFELPIILGWDAAGVIDEVGEGVTDYEVGDKVFARPELTNRGTYAEYAAIDAHLLAKIPENISYDEAAATPLTALTAWQCLFEHGNVKEGDKVLIHAGSGGVGSFAIQLAKNAGAYVATTCSTKNVDLVKDLGADEVIDYKKQNFEEVLSNYDFVLDTLGGDVQKKSYLVLKSGGDLASVAEPPEEDKAETFGVNAFFVWLEPKGEQLQQIAKQMEDSKLKVIVGHRFPLSEQGLQDAHELSETHHAKGKIVIQVQ
ncbi:NADP-dependent oxidoreductase [Aquisalibacillus elongatus]|uniref:NADPH:quinone reductase-like Zn-dependent oxidoreductase n=1 Tax=Aquisalibacillus elongatus TaxID=485577 RepID=A0A3N5B901_9BACI|nr:NADP-dependent oxidoreductase [Aquisalibacillus elongatus]RPF53944.1 NADPH:quinone reductase-like Zn-dependent oxidoreductase [Aquisalibacillus elongatus]